MDRQTSIKLLTDSITNSIKPLNHYGRNIKEKFELYGSKDKDKLIEELNIIYQTIEGISEDKIAKVSSIIENINNIDLILKKLENGYLETYEIFEIKKLLYFYNELCKLPWNLPYLKSDVKDILKILNPEGRNGYTFYVYDSYSEKLRLLRGKEKNVKDKIKSEINKIRLELKNKYSLTVIGEEFVVAKSKRKLIDNILKSQMVMVSRETFSNIYLKLRDNEKIEKLKTENYNIQKSIETEEKNVLKSISSDIRNNVERIKIILKEIGMIDFLFAKIKFIKTFNYCLPQIYDDEFSFSNLSFIPLAKNINYMPVTSKIPKGLTILVGTNMGGKSTFLKTVGLAEFMLKYGLLLPADSIKLPLLDDVFFVNEDIESESLSSFAINVERLIKGLERENNTLLLIDEFAKGTNPIEGDALASSVAEWIDKNRKNNFTIFATHFIGPVNKNYHLLKVGRIKKDFNSIYDAIDHSVNEYEGDFPMEALKISEFIGLDKKIIKNAKERIKNGSN